MSNQQLFQVVTCAHCDMQFGIIIKFMDKRKNDHKTFYCPKGHSQYYPEKSDKEKLEIENNRLNQANESLTEDLSSARKSVIAYKGHLTRVKKK